MSEYFKERENFGVDEFQLLIILILVPINVSFKVKFNGYDVTFNDTKNVNESSNIFFYLTLICVFRAIKICFVVINKIVVVHWIFFMFFYETIIENNY